VLSVPPALAASHSGGHSSSASQGSPDHGSDTVGHGVNGGGTTGDGSPCPVNMSTCT